MSTATAPPDKISPAARPPSGWVKRTLSNRIVWIGLAVWIVFSAAIPLLAHGVIPFDQPMIATLPYQMRVMIEVFGPVVAFIFIAVVYVLTRRRVMDIADRAPERSIALRETVGLLTYGALVMIGGVIVGTLPEHTASDYISRAACSALVIPLRRVRSGFGPSTILRFMPLSPTCGFGGAAIHGSSFA